MLDLATREDALQTVLQEHYFGVPLHVRDILILRAVWQGRQHAADRTTRALAEATGLPLADVCERLVTLHRNDWLAQRVGFNLTPRAQALTTLLWVCATCGCTEEYACPDRCWWVRPDQCSRCTNPDNEDYATRLRLVPPIRFPRRGVTR